MDSVIAVGLVESAASGCSCRRDRALGFLSWLVMVIGEAGTRLDVTCDAVAVAVEVIRILADDLDGAGVVRTVAGPALAVVVG